MYRAVSILFPVIGFFLYEIYLLLFQLLLLLLLLLLIHLPRDFISILKLCGVCTGG
jgi:hypothetical protein